ncbi:aspartyl protease family protein 1 isoform X2 [Prunus avium]|uniref:Aspartyl protease family protein 1 isoform X2 n=1 Tax=Prunus avium TaxID=42229 RepID=A0A6P5SK06_PRUAV|nr:aspartyl protease family protein 1 isoform X2 [Prunus avium]
MLTDLCNFVVLLFFLSILGLQSCHGRIFSFKMHHRFSDPVKEWSAVSGKLSPADNLPAKGSFEYYAELARRDRFLRGRKLAQSDQSDTTPLAFSDGNSTFRISSLGFLHYTTVQLGTPGMKFMVALDTGSDLFWVPCEGTAYAPDFEVSKYDPEGSSTSKRVSCNDSLCAHRNRCMGSFNNCPYMVSYVSAETSTSGILVEDVLHLKTEDSHRELVEAYVTFGCKAVLSWMLQLLMVCLGLVWRRFLFLAFYPGKALQPILFPCVSDMMGLGELILVTRGVLTRKRPHLMSTRHSKCPTYNITVTQIRVGTDLMDIDFTALFDSGTSFTYLGDPTYTRLSESFNSLARDKRRPPDPRIPFEYCYDMSSDANASFIPSLSLTMKGGSQFAVYDPIIVISTQSELVYCLAVVKSTQLNIIGQNFMTGYNVVFDREKFVLGWKKFDCYDVENHTSLPFKPKSTNVPPAVAAGLGNHSTPESTKKTRNSQTSAASLPYHSHFPLTWFRFVILLFVLL